MLRPIALATTTFLLPGFAAHAATAGLLQDLSLEVTAAASANSGVGGFFEGELFVDSEEVEEDGFASSFDELPLVLAADSFATAEVLPPHPGFFGSTAGAGSVVVDADRIGNELTISGELRSREDFTSSDVFDRTSGGAAEINFAYRFRILEDAFATLSLDSSFPDGQPVNGSSVTRIGGDVDLLEVFDLGTSFRDAPDLSDTALLDAGDYQLTYRSELRSVGGLEVAPFAIDFTVAPVATAVPSPVAASAGLALLGGLVARRRQRDA